MIAPGRVWQKPINSCDCGCDTFYHFASGCRVRKLVDGQVSTVAGSGIRGFRDGPAAQAEFNHLYDVVELESGDLVIADAQNHRIRVWKSKSNTVQTLAGTGRRGHRDGTQAEFNYPTGLAVDQQAQLLFVTDRQNNCVRQVDLASGAATTIAGNCSSGNWGQKDGPALTAMFNGPSELVLAGTTLYVTDSGNGAVRVIDLVRKTVATLTTSSGSADLYFPMGLVMVSTDVLSLLNAVRRVIPRCS